MRLPSGHPTLIMPASCWTELADPPNLAPEHSPDGNSCQKRGAVAIRSDRGRDSARLRRAGLRCFEGLGGSTRRRRYTAPQRKQGENAVNRGALYHSFPVVAARLVHDPPASILPRWWARWGRRARRPPCYVPYGGSVARSDANRSKGLSPNALERRPVHHLGASAVGLCSGA